MRKLSILALSICALTLAACGPENAAEMDKHMVEKFQYVIDPNTGLCFARFATEGGHSSIMYTYVPCTDKVKENLYNPQR